MTQHNRIAEIERKTKETHIKVRVDLDGAGAAQIVTGVGFFDHMLEQIARHGLMDLSIGAEGDLHIDDHHTVEDVGIALGAAIGKALGDKTGIRRYGHAIVPMDEALVLCALDFSGRGHLEYSLSYASPKIGTFDTELIVEFFRAVALNCGATVHIRRLAGRNSHHVCEAAFKAFARAVDAAKQRDERVVGVPSSKGAL
jgi:imidazoleglycerol-phosphate dehydratase